MKNLVKYTLAALAIALVTACGDSSNDSNSSISPWVGTKQMGVAGAFTDAFSVTTDASGNVYVAGGTNGRLDGNTFRGTNDFFVTKYNSSGVKQYTKQLGATGAYVAAYSVATDASGNVYVVGGSNSGLDGNPRIGINDYFITKYDSSGVKQYTKQVGVAGSEISVNSNSATTDASGNVYVAGSTTAGMDGNNLSGSMDAFVTKYDSNGVKQYTKQMGAAGARLVRNLVATDASGNVYVAGSTDRGLDRNTLTGSKDFFVTKYNSNGDKQYTKQMGVAGSAVTAYSLATDASGNVYVAGSTSGGLDRNTLTGITDFFVTKFNSNGDYQYTKQMGVAGSSTDALSVATDASGNVYVAGSTSGGLDGNTLTGSKDFFVTKYNSNGVKQYTKQLGVAGADTDAYSLATDASGNVYVAGGTRGGLDGNTRTGTTDFFVTKYNSSGVKQ